MMSPNLRMVESTKVVFLAIINEKKIFEKVLLKNSFYKIIPI